MSKLKLRRRNRNIKEELSEAAKAFVKAGVIKSVKEGWGEGLELHTTIHYSSGEVKADLYLNNIYVASYYKPDGTVYIRPSLVGTHWLSAEDMAV